MPGLVLLQMYIKNVHLTQIELNALLSNLYNFYSNIITYYVSTSHCESFNIKKLYGSNIKFFRVKYLWMHLIFQFIATINNLYLTHLSSFRSCHKFLSILEA
jgi:hypothetical protein